MLEQDFNMYWVRKIEELEPYLKEDLEKKLSKTFPVVFEDLVLGIGSHESLRLRCMLLELVTDRWIFARRPQDIVEAPSGNYHVMAMLNYMEVMVRDSDNKLISRGFAFGRIPSMDRTLYRTTLLNLVGRTNSLLQEIGLAPFPSYQ